MGEHYGRSFFSMGESISSHLTYRKIYDIVSSPLGEFMFQSRHQKKIYYIVSSPMGESMFQSPTQGKTYDRRLPYWRMYDSVSSHMGEPLFQSHQLWENLLYSILPSEKSMFRSPSHGSHL